MAWPRRRLTRRVPLVPIRSALLALALAGCDLVLLAKPEELEAVMRKAIARESHPNPDDHEDMSGHEWTCAWKGLPAPAHSPTPHHQHAHALITVALAPTACGRDCPTRRALMHEHMRMLISSHQR